MPIAEDSAGGSPVPVPTDLTTNLTGQATGSGTLDYTTGDIDIVVTVVDNGHNHILDNITDVQVNNAISGQILVYNGTVWANATNTAGITALVQDTSPQLGGNLDLNNRNITGTGNIAITGTIDGRDVSADGTKLDGIESGATADQTAAQIKTAYESNANTNNFADADVSKLSGIEPGATADQTATQIKTAYESNADTNAFTDADHTKLDGITAGADVTLSEISAGTNVTISAGGVISATGGTSGIAHVVDDTSPELGGNLSLNSHDITGTGNINIAGTVALDDALIVRNTSGYGRVEVGGTSGGYIDLKSPFSDDHDLRIITTGLGGTIDGKTGNINLQRSSVTKLSVTPNGIDVTGNVEFDGLSGTGSVTITDIADEDNMASNSATKLATQQSIKAYVDAQVGTADTLSEVLGLGNTTGGTDIAVSANDDITFADSSKAIFGAGSDLEIYHDGSSSYIDDKGAGNLFIRSNDVFIDSYANANPRMIRALADGAVTLYYDGSSRLATEDDGVNIIGTVTANDVTVSGNTPTVLLKDINSSGTAAKALIQYEDSVGSTGYIGFASEFNEDFTINNYKSSNLDLRTNNTTSMRINSSGNVGINNTNPQSRLDVTGNIAVSGTVDSVDIAARDAVLTTTTNTANAALPKAGGTMTGNLRFNDGVKAQFGNSNDLQIWHNGTDSYVYDTGEGDLILRGSSNIKLQSSSGTALSTFTAAGASTLYYSAAEKLATTSTGIDVTGTITATGTSTFDSIDISEIEIGSGGGNAATDARNIGSKSSYLLIQRDQAASIEIWGSRIESRSTHYFGGSNTTAEASIDTSGNITTTGTISSGNLDVTGNIGLSSTQPTITLTDTDGPYSSYIAKNGSVLTVDGDSVRFRSTAGTEYMRVTSSGIDVTGSTNTDTLNVSTGTTGWLATMSNPTASGNGLQINAGDNAGDRILQLADKDGNEALRVTGERKVGIGTSAPTSLLHLASTAPYITLEDTDNNQDWQIQATAWFAIRDQTANAERMRIDSSGKVGIGTTAPKTKTQITSGGTLNAPSLGSSSSNAPLYLTNNDTNYGLVVGNSSADGHVWLQAQRTDGTATAYNMTLNEAGGNVGIGDATPEAPLTVTGTIKSNGSGYFTGNTQWVTKAALITTGSYGGGITMIDGSKAYSFHTQSGGDILIIKQGATSGTPTEKLRIDSTKLKVSGNLETTGHINISASSAPTWDTGNRLWTESGWGSRYDGYQHRWDVGLTRAEAMRIDASGNVGIGTTSPADLLDVRGDGADTYIRIGSDTVSGNDAGRIGKIDSSTDFVIQASLGATASNTIFKRNTTAETMRIDASGNVGIGYTSLSHKLAVNGGVMAKNGFVIGEAGDNYLYGGTDIVSLRVGTSGSYRYFQFTDTSSGSRIGTASGKLSLGVSTNDYLTIDSSGNIGINNSSPSALLEIGNGDDNTLGTTAGDVLDNLHITSDTNNSDKLLIQAKRTATGTSWTSAAQRLQRKVDASLMGYMQYGSHSSDLITFGKGASTEYMRIDSSGNCGIGTALPSARLDVNGNARFNGDIDLRYVGGAGRTLRLTRQDSTINNGDIIGQIAFAHTDTDASGDCGYIKSTGSGSSGNAIMSFHTGTPGSVTQTMKIDGTGMDVTGSITATGTLEIGTLTPAQDGAIEVGVLALGTPAIASTTDSTGLRNHIIFDNPNGVVGRINTVNSSTVYLTSSDYRLKTDVQEMTGSIDRVKALKPVNFEWIVDGTRVDGFLAHEAQEIVPESVNGEKDAMRDQEYVESEATGDIYTPAVDATYETIQVELTPAVEAVYETVTIEIIPAVDAVYETVTVEISPAVEATYDDEGNELTPAVEAITEEQEQLVTPAIEAVTEEQKQLVTPASDATYEEQEQELTPAIDEVIHSSDVVEPDELEEGQRWRETTEKVMATRQVPDYQGIDQSKLVPLLTSALQDAIAKIEALETRLEALES